MTFSIPIRVTSTGGSVVHILPLPSDSTTQTVPVSATAKFAPRDADLRLQELLAQVQAGRLRQVGGLVGEVLCAELSHEQLPDLRAVLVDRRHQDVRGGLPGELDDELREVRLVGVDALALQVLVELGLVGRYGLDLDDLSRRRGPWRSRR